MKVKDYFDLIKTSNINEFINVLFQLYPEQEKNKEGYLLALGHIFKIKPSDMKTTMKVVIEHVKEEWDHCDNDDYICVSGFDPEATLDQELGEFFYEPKELSWALEYSDWAEWLDMEVIVRTDDERCDSNYKVLAHILFEMTWCGYTPTNVKVDFP